MSAANVRVPSLGPSGPSCPTFIFAEERMLSRTTIDIAVPEISGLFSSATCFKTVDPPPLRPILAHSATIIYRSVKNVHCPFPNFLFQSNKYASGILTCRFFFSVSGKPRKMQNKLTAFPNGSHFRFAFRRLRFSRVHAFISNYSYIRTFTLEQRA